MEEQKQTTAVVRADRAPVVFGPRGVHIESMESLARFAEMVAKSGLAPKGVDTPAAIAVAVEMGLEIGLSPMAALQNIAVVNGRPCIYGDAALALCRASGLLESYAQEWTGEGDKRAATVTVKREGDPQPVVSSFSVHDAKAAGLWGKAGPWTQYPDRMLLFRARGFALRDAFGDVLKGLKTAEEQGDIIDVTPREPADRTAEVRARMAATAPAEAAEQGGQAQ